MIPSVLRPKIWNYNYGNRKAYSGDLSIVLVDIMYPEKDMTYGELCESVEKRGFGPRNNTRLALYRLRRRGLVTRAGKRYLLTEPGRWFAISHRLEISFLEMCVLACACCVHARYAKSGKAGFYMRSYFERTLKEYYSKKRIDNIFSDLITKGFASRYVKKTIRIYPEVRKEIMAQYGHYFKNLESWLDGLEESELEIFEKTLEGFSWEKFSGKIR